MVIVFRYYTNCQLWPYAYSLHSPTKFRVQSNQATCRLYPAIHSTKLKQALSSALHRQKYWNWDSARLWDKWNGSRDRLVWKTWKRILIKTDYYKFHVLSVFICIIENLNCHFHYCINASEWFMQHTITSKMFKTVAGLWHVCNSCFSMWLFRWLGC